MYIILPIICGVWISLMWSWTFNDMNLNDRCEKRDGKSSAWKFREEEKRRGKVEYVNFKLFNAQASQLYALIEKKINSLKWTCHVSLYVCET